MVSKKFSRSINIKFETVSTDIKVVSEQQKWNNFSLKDLYRTCLVCKIHCLGGLDTQYNEKTYRDLLVRFQKLFRPANSVVLFHIEQWTFCRGHKNILNFLM